MRHGDRVKKLGRTREHRRALLRNLCRSLFIFEKIKTTLPKAKAARQMAERLIEYAKRNDLTAKRQIYRYLPDHKLVKIICDDIGPKFADRTGGYTRIYRMGPRLGDGAEMAILELVEQSDASVIAQRRKLIERRRLVEIKKEKKQKEKKVKEKKPKAKEKEKVEKKKTSKKAPKTEQKKKKKEKSK
jgi:large subunit ribosomal protein L17